MGVRLVNDPEENEAKAMGISESRDGKVKIHHWVKELVGRFQNGQGWVESHDALARLQVS